MVESILKLVNYNVLNISFSLNLEYQYQQHGPIEVNPRLTRQIKKIDENKAEVVLAFAIQKTDELPTPFDLEITIMGIFECEQWETESPDIMKINTVAILFPFLRSLIATVTANASVPPYVLPVLNVEQWLKETETK